MTWSATDVAERWIHTTSSMVAGRTWNRISDMVDGGRDYLIAILLRIGSFVYTYLGANLVCNFSSYTPSPLPSAGHLHRPSWIQ